MTHMELFVFRVLYSNECRKKGTIEISGHYGMRDIIGKTNLPQIMEAAILFWWCLQDDVIILHEDILKSEGNCSPSRQMTNQFNKSLYSMERWYPVKTFFMDGNFKSPREQSSMTMKLNQKGG